ncbi:phosphate signaling complex protein PhoU [Candidatus Bipolaricaulota bacterium]|nr:phosphate signaling complex protein PhoU [Candidatus Bipolaricaulota bacterium]
MVRKEELSGLEGELRALGAQVVRALREAMRALARRDLVAAQRVIEGDGGINARRAALEERCIRLLATQQPAASDLRLVTGVMHIATDLERAADHAKGLARITLFIGDEALIKPLVDLPRMAKLAAGMLSGALRAFSARDVIAAREVARRDDEVDALHDRIHQELFALMVGRPEVIRQATYLMWASHAVERVADLATNICERVVFVATGVMEELNPVPGEG